MYRVFIVFLMAIISSCQNPTEQQTVINTDTTSVIVDTTNPHLSIVDSLMLNYREKYNAFRGTPGADTSVAWMFSNEEKTDTATYLVYQVIHDVSEPDGSETRMVTDAWVYIDTVKRRLYEYDVTTESLK